MLSDDKLDQLHAAAAANALSTTERIYAEIGVDEPGEASYDEAVQAMMTAAMVLVFTVAIMAEHNGMSPVEQAEQTVGAFMKEVASYQNFDPNSH